MKAASGASHPKHGEAARTSNHALGDHSELPERVGRSLHQVLGPGALPDHGQFGTHSERFFEKK